MKKFYVDKFYNSEFRIMERILAFLLVFSPLLIICLVLFSNDSKLEDCIFEFFSLFIGLCFFTHSVIRKSCAIDSGFIKTKKKKIDIKSINYVLITQRFEQIRRSGGIEPLYEKTNGRKMVIARMFFQDEFRFNAYRCENSSKFEHTSDIRLSYYNTLFRADYQTNLLETLFENGLKTELYIKRKVFEERMQDFNNIFQKYNDRIKRVCIFS